MSKTYTLINQHAAKNRVIFDLRDEGSCYRATLSDTGLGTGLAPPNKSHIVSEQVVSFEASAEPVDNGSLDDILAEIQAMTSDTVEGNQNTRHTVLSHYIFLTYCASLFSSLPVLWLCVPYDALRKELASLLESLCFNGVIIYPYYSSEVIIQNISTYTPTLIIADPDQFKKSDLNYLIHFPNTVTRRFVTPDNYTTQQIYGPKIVLADRYPKRNFWGHMLTISLAGYSLPASAPVDDFPKLRSRMMKSVLNCSKQIVDYATSSNRADCSMRVMFPLIGLSEYLKVRSPRPDHYSKIISYLIDQIGGWNKTIPLNDHQEIITALREFIDKNHDSIKNNSGFFSLTELAEFINSEYDLLKGINEKVLSQKLNKIPRLVRTRKRMLIPVVGKVQTKRTCIEINEAALTDNLPK